MSLGCEISTAELLADANNVGAGAIECVSWDSTGFYSRTPPGLVESAACKKTQTLLRMLSIPADNAACEIVMVEFTLSIPMNVFSKIYLLSRPHRNVLQSNKSVSSRFQRAK
ncbi:predicted protein [Coccidioides posadasii str. Silveira]|uniref:Predicted protein n=2 Tax=Coccidioides posadasii TaxID=199306 RepID=E9CZY9_COCPS|nr:predicted protein [Coccidioides posadasii str. Silveira]KMM73196.1 hypothetical protein CPAG_09485 [Coccidioides posadasii RMSCC 3488]